MVLNLSSPLSETFSDYLRRIDPSVLLWRSAEQPLKDPDYRISTNKSVYIHVNNNMFKLCSVLFLIASTQVLAKPSTPPFTPSETMYATLDWSWSGNNYDIKTIDNNVRYRIKQKLISIGHDFAIENTTGTQVAKVEQQIFAWFGPKYLVSYNAPDGSKKTATIQRRYSWGFPTAYKSFNIYLGGGESYTTHGSLLAWKFTIVANDQKTVAKVEIKDHNFINLHWPGSQVFQIDTDTSRISNAFPMALLNIVEWLSKTSKQW